jgi:tRNA pseudouridine55 synthase
VDGRKLYEYARKGQVVDVPPRDIEVREHVVESVAFPDVTLRARVSKGTYIRKLAEDLAESLGTVGHVCMLRRTSSGPFALDQAVALEAVTPEHVRTVKV